MGYKKFGKLVDRLVRIYRKTLQKAAKYIAKRDAVISSLEMNIFDVDMFNEIKSKEPED